MSQPPPETGKPDYGVTRPSPPPPAPATAPPQRTAAMAGAPRAQRPAPRNRLRFYLPLWSIALMFVIVLAAAFCMVFAVVSLGGQTVTGGKPRVVILTAAPLDSGQSGLNQAAPTPTESTDLGIQGSPQNFAMEGPTLPSVIFTPTTEPIAIGKTVVVSAPESGLNVRSGPARTNEVLFVAPDKLLMTVLDGPVSSDDGLIWWKVQSQTDASQVGWAAQSYLEIPKS